MAATAGLTPRGPGALGNSLKLAGVDLTTTSFDRMHGEHRIADPKPKVRSAGKSANDYADSAALALCSDRAAPFPGKFDAPEPKPPVPETPSGMPSGEGGECVGVAETFRAGQCFGIEEYIRARGEAIYQSTKREPLGRSYARGHVLPQAPPKGYGKSAGARVGNIDEAKEAMFPRDTEALRPEAHKNYIKTHGSYNPGEMVNRGYNWPKQVSGDPHFRFGLPDLGEGTGVRGTGVKDALSMERDIGGTYPQTRIVQRTSEDFRQVANDHLGKSRHLGQGSPPVAPDHAFGVLRVGQDGTAGSLIRGRYPVAEQMPDADLGKCTKVGHRNFETEKYFGVPSVRLDLSAPPVHRRSVADPRNYGDEVDAGSLIRPQRFELLGVPDSEFVRRRPQEELASIVAGAGYEVSKEDFQEIWNHLTSIPAFEGGAVSLEAFMAVYSDLRNFRSSSAPLTVR